MPKYLVVSRSISGLNVDIIEDFKRIAQIPIEVYVQAYEVEHEDILVIKSLSEKEYSNVIEAYLKENMKMVYDSLAIERSIEPLDSDNIRKKILQNQILSKFSKDFSTSLDIFLSGVGIKEEDIVDILLGMENVIDKNTLIQNVTLEEIQYQVTCVILNKLVQYRLKNGTMHYDFTIEDVMNILNLKERILE